MPGNTKTTTPAPVPTDERREAPGVGRTERKRGTEVEPRLPHERDESADSQARGDSTRGEVFNKDVGEQAFHDLQSGQQDTGRMPVTDKTYEGLRKQPQTQKKRAGTQGE